jgi:hypothetical protein
MTRFDLLAILERQMQPISCAQIAKLTGQRRYYSRSFQADSATRLRKLNRWGLLRCRRIYRRRLWGSRHRGPRYLWSLSRRGRARLEWARRRDLVELFKQAFAEVGRNLSSLVAGCVTTSHANLAFASICLLPISDVGYCAAGRADSCNRDCLCVS